MSSGAVTGSRPRGGEGKGSKRSQTPRMSTRRGECHSSAAQSLRRHKVQPTWRVGRRSSALTELVLIVLPASTTRSLQAVVGSTGERGACRNASGCRHAGRGHPRLVRAKLPKPIGIFKDEIPVRPATRLPQAIMAILSASGAKIPVRPLRASPRLSTVPSEVSLRSPGRKWGVLGVCKSGANVVPRPNVPLHVPDQPRSRDTCLPRNVGLLDI